MKVLSIGSDRKVFEDGSPVVKRSVSYGRQMQALHIVVFSLKKMNLLEKKLSDNVFIYPTNSISRLFYIWDAIALSKKIIRQKGFVRGEAVVTCQDPFESGFVGFIVSRVFRLPLHLQVHTDFLSKYFQTSFLQKIRVIIGKFLIPRASGVRVVSSRIANSFLKSGIKFQNPPVILPIRVSVEIKKDPKSDLKKMFPESKFIILMASRLSKEKRISDGILAFSKVYKDHPFALLVIAGDGPERKNLEQKVKTLGLENSVAFLGFREDVTELMSTAHMFLSTSEYEGYGMSLVESGLCHCPLVSTNTGIAGSILVDRKNALICEVGDIDCISKGIVLYINDNVMRYALTETLFNDLSKLQMTEEEYVKKYIEQLESLTIIKKIK